jgi:hypothetical protein
MAAIRVSEVRQMVKALMGMLGWDPSKFGAHSLRIGGATAAMEGRLSPDTIRIAGRWSSDCYLIDCRATRGGVSQIARIVGSTAFEDMARYDFSDDLELLLTPAELEAAKKISLTKEMLDDASVGDEEDD